MIIKIEVVADKCDLKCNIYIIINRETDYGIIAPNAPFNEPKTPPTTCFGGLFSSLLS